MNALPPASDRPMEVGRATQLVAKVQPARRVAQEDAQEEKDARGSAGKIANPAEREKLVRDYLHANDTLMPDNGRVARRALQAYGEIASGEKREQLADMLGVDLFA